MYTPTCRQLTKTTQHWRGKKWSKMADVAKCRANIFWHVANMSSNTSMLHQNWQHQHPTNPTKMIITLIFCVDVKWQISQQPSLFPKLLLCHWQITPLSFWKHPVVIVETFKVKVYLPVPRHFSAQPFCPVMVLAFAWQLFSSLHLHLAPFLGSLIVLQLQYWCQNFERVLCLILPSHLVESVSSAILRCQSYLWECISRRGLLHYSEGSVLVLR